ncbi:DUF3575 domain-containing protein [Parabacteroides sp. AM08-6]|uniref:DUF3575 domain-containing protein n=1 Tax=Parabacteroides sp. AM08-6 TaxID=2292053 RepID=UPI000F006481|nr:DUF3575 domain-containing protein [Parabacteroides sp. AM08-6]RHJ78716.1 DUF3575 domain-containing protein [Parabacteroides sp. AM08-6]
MNKIFLVIIFCVCLGLNAKAQVIAVKTNVLYDATTTFNLGAEVAFNKHLSLDISGNYNPWTFNDDKSIKHWSVQPEFRYWIHERFNGHFLGVHGLYADYDVAGQSILNVMKSGYAYDGNAYGGGISYGYQLYLSPHWNIEFTAGVGYVYFSYDKKPFPTGGEVIGRYRNNYFGPTKLGISIMYIIK